MCLRDTIHGALVALIRKGIRYSYPFERRANSPRGVTSLVHWHHGPDASFYVPQIQLVAHGVVSVSEGSHLALLARQILAELLEIVLQCTARMLSGLQLAVQPQHTGLLLEELFPLALWKTEAETEWSVLQAPWDAQTTPYFPTLPAAR